MQALSIGTDTETRRVSLFRNGKNQALRIPRDLEMPGKEAILYREGNRLVVEPVPEPSSLLETLSRLQSLDEEFPDVDETLGALDSPEI